jgi:4-hydroxymandelate oxidase
MEPPPVPNSVRTARREFLKFLAASPYVASLGGVAAYLESSGLLAHAQAQQQAPGTADVISSPAEALDVFDFEPAAQRKVQQGHWAYMKSGVEDDATLRANREGFNHVELRPRRLRDATKVDMRVNLGGTVYESPIFTCPTGGERAFFPDGELSVARACKARGTLQFLSTVSSTPVEDVNRELGRPVW